MKRLTTLLLAAILMLSLTACRKTCKSEGCEKEATQEGYCDYHYTVQQAKEGLDKLGQNIYEALN